MREERHPLISARRWDVRKTRSLSDWEPWGIPFGKEVDVGGIVSGRADGLDIGFLVELG